MDRDGIAFVFHHDARPFVGDARDLGLELGIKESGGTVHRPVGEAHFGAMARDGRKLKRGEEQIEFGERAATDESERATEAFGKPLKCDGKIGRHDHLKRCRREVEDRPVDVKQNGPGRQGNGIDEQFALRNFDF